MLPASRAITILLQLMCVKGVFVVLVCFFITCNFIVSFSYFFGGREKLNKAIPLTFTVGSTAKYISPLYPSYVARKLQNVNLC